LAILLDTDSVTLCPFTTDPTEAPLFRLLIEPDQGHRPRSAQPDLAGPMPQRYQSRGPSRPAAAARPL